MRTYPEIFDIPEAEAKRRAESVAAAEQMFLDGARRALAAVGMGPLEFLAANPGIPVVALAKLLNRGASAIGLVMDVYREAVEKGRVREVAKDMLIRQINDYFPYGWDSSNLDNIGPRFKIDGWRLALLNFSRDERWDESALAIVRELADDHPPPRFWKPKPKDDPLIDELFDRFWPVELEDTNA